MTDKKNLPNSFLNFRIMKAVKDFVNPEKCIQMPIVSGKGPGAFDLMISQFPPSQLHQNDVPVKFTIDYGLLGHFSLKVMIVMLSDTNIIGFVSHDKIDMFRKKVKEARDIDGANFIVGAEYSPITRNGWIFLYKDLENIIMKFNKFNNRRSS